MILHKDRKMFRESIQATAQHMGIPEVYIEKDYWVSLVLKELFTSELSNQIVFKRMVKKASLFSNYFQCS